MLDFDQLCIKRHIQRELEHKSMPTLFYHHSKQCSELDGAVSLPLDKMNAKTSRCLSISSPKDRVVLHPILKTEYPTIRTF